MLTTELWNILAHQQNVLLFIKIMTGRSGSDRDARPLTDGYIIQTLSKDGRSSSNEEPSLSPADKGEEIPPRNYVRIWGIWNRKTEDHNEPSVMGYWRWHFWDVKFFWEAISDDMHEIRDLILAPEDKERKVKPDCFNSQRNRDRACGNISRWKWKLAGDNR